MRRLLARRGRDPRRHPAAQWAAPGHDGRYAPFDRAAYRERNRVERMVNRLKQQRRVAIRYQKRAGHYFGMLALGALLL